MSPLKRFFAFLLALMLASAPGCISIPIYDGPGDHVTEKSWVTTKAKATLVEDSQVDAAETL